MQEGVEPSFPPPPWLPPGGGGEVVAGCKEGISRKGMIRATSPAATSVPPPIFSGFATQFSCFVVPESHAPRLRSSDKCQ